MASSDLTLAQLLSGQNQMQDPAVAAMAPRLQMAQAMLQEGTSAAPTSGRYGGLARLAQALVGAYGMNQATSGLQDIAQQRRSDALNLSNAWNAPPAAAPAAPMPQSPGAGPAASLPLPTPQPAQASAGPGNVPPELMPHFQAASTATGIPVPVLLAQARQESNFNPNAIGKNGEVGITQIKPSTAALPGFGLDGVNPGNLKDPATNIMFGAKYLAARGKDAGVTDWNNPDHVALGLKSYNGGGDPNYVQHVTRYLPSAGGGQSVQVAGPGAPTGSPAPSVHDAHSTYNAVTQKWEGEPTSTAAAPTGGVTPAVSPAAVPQQPQQLQTGMNAPNVARGMAMIKEAHQAMLTNPYNPQVQMLAQQHIDEAKMIMGLDTVVQNPNGTQTRLNTGEQINAAAPNSHFVQTPQGFVDTTGLKPGTFAPAPRPFTDTQGNTGAVGPGGAVTPLASNPSGITGTAPETNAMRTMAEIGPKIIAGTATAQEKANYDVAAHAYQGFKTATDPASKSIVSLPERSLPPGMPQAPGASAAGASPQQLTGSPRGPDTADAIVKDQAANDVKHVSDQQAQILQGHNTLNTTATIRAMQPDVKTGAGADMRLLTSQVAAALGANPEQVQHYIGTNPVQGELLQKKLFELSTGAVRGMGAREPGSVMTMFQKNYPNLSSQNMTIDAMTRLLDMDQTYKEDEIAAQRSHLDVGVAGVRDGKSYSGLTGYQPPDPRVYQASALATAGMPYKTWSQGLTPEQQTQALKLGARLYPDASALDDKGVKHVFQRPPNG